jgi:FkbM family methyltransferase
MRKPHEWGWLGTLTQKITPALSWLLLRRPVAPLLRLAETYLALVQGKGAGSGWDMSSEIRVASAQIRRRQPILLDAGANRGEWSQQMLAALDGREATIYLFEPSRHCQQIIHSLGLPRATLIPAAVGAEEGEAQLFSDAPGSAQASLFIRRDSVHRQAAPPAGEQVAVVTIDGVLDRVGLELVDFLKLDVEGNELAALRGAGRALAAHRIRALSFEFGSGNINSRTYFHDFWDLLHPLGYRIFRIAPGGVLVPILEYYEDLEYFRGVSNYLAIV